MVFSRPSRSALQQDCTGEIGPGMVARVCRDCNGNSLIRQSWPSVSKAVAGNIADCAEPASFQR